MACEIFVRYPCNGCSPVPGLIAASQRASQLARPSAQNRSLSMLLQDAWGWWLWEKAPVLEEPIPFNLTVEFGNEVGWEWLEGGIRASQVAANAANLHYTAEERPPAIPEQWDSGACMDSWGVPELQREIDPRGYIVFREGRCDAFPRRTRLHFPPYVGLKTTPIFVYGCRR